MKANLRQILRHNTPTCAWHTDQSLPISQRIWAGVTPNHAARTHRLLSPRYQTIMSSMPCHLSALQTKVESQGESSAQGQVISALSWPSLHWFLALSCLKRLLTELPVHREQYPGMPVTVWLRAILLLSSSLPAHVVSLQRETQRQTPRCR